MRPQDLRRNTWPFSAKGMSCDLHRAGFSFETVKLEAITQPVDAGRPAFWLGNWAQQ